MKLSLISISASLLFLLPWLVTNSGCTEKRNAGDVAASENGGERCSTARLTSVGWRFLRGEGAFAEGYAYQFLPDGAYRWGVISDYSESVLWSVIIFFLKKGFAAETPPLGWFTERPRSRIISSKSQAHAIPAEG